MAQDAIAEAFSQYDNGHKGYLTAAEFRPFAEYLTVVCKVLPALLLGLTKGVAVSEHVTLEDVRRACEGGVALNLLQVWEAPGARIIKLLQKLKAIPGLPENYKQGLKLGIEQVMSGRLYQTEVRKPASDPQLSQGASLSETQKQKEQQLSGWMEALATPKLGLDLLEKYRSTKFGMLQRPTGRKRKTVIIRDLAEEIRTSPKGPDLIPNVNNADFDIFAYEKAVGRDKVLPMMSYYVLSAHRVFSLLDEGAFEDFIEVIRDGYVKDNPYHNDLHAADVLQLCHYMLLRGLKEVAKLDNLDVLAFLLSAIIHDFKHPGKNNGYLANSKDDLALLYNDNAILENYHASQAMQLIYKDKKCDIFYKLTAEERKIIRRKIWQMVVATDAAKHFEHFATLQHLISGLSIEGGTNSDLIINMSTGLTEYESKQKLLNVCLHAADIGNAARPWSVAYEAACRVTAEFHAQGDLEKAQHLPISFLCDRNVGTLPASQLGFINNVLRPYFEKLVEVFPKFSHLMTNIIAVTNGWENPGSFLPFSHTLSLSFFPVSVRLCTTYIHNEGMTSFLLSHSIS